MVVMVVEMVEDPDIRDPRSAIRDPRSALYMWGVQLLVIRCFHIFHFSCSVFIGGFGLLIEKSLSSKATRFRYI